MRLAMKIHKPQRSPNLLPEEIIEEILLLLDVKSLLRFRCVTKSYRSLIDSKRFIKTHLQKSTKDKTLAHHRVLIFSPGLAKVSGCSLLSFFDNSDNAPELNFPTNIPSYSSISFVGCCNGLVCILLHTLENSKQFMLWNPSTRISKKLPDLDKKIKGGWSNFQCFGLGWDESSDDYKVVAIVRVGKKTICQIYSLKTDSWKQINACCHMKCRYFSEPGMLASGKLHWDHNDFTKSRLHQWEIVAFDLKEEEFEIVKQPPYSKGAGIFQCLGMFGDQCLAVQCCYENGYQEIWAMKEYGVIESWEKVMVLPCYYDLYGIWISPSVSAFYSGEKGEMILMNLSYNLDLKHLAYDMKGKRFHCTNGIGESDIYIESLVSPYRSKTH